MFQWGEWERAAARAGDREVCAGRQAIRAALHWPDAVSVLEHALSGIGFALAGVVLLQLFYFAYWPHTPQPIETPRWLRWICIVLAAAIAVAVVWRFAYLGTGTAMAVLTALAVAALLEHHACVARIARTAPQWLIGIAGAAVWSNFDLAWKVSAWPTTHDSLGVVLAQLLASSGVLLICSALAGALIRRCAWLRPAGA
ncbi:hypothetical protein DIE18_31260 [Burkholderia sp. Bp9125]|nr:hypothetical protein DIE18_31260 [Burkholderia sp. Bp9125]